MKLLRLTTFLIVLILTFSGCVGSTPKPSDTPVIDKTLPVIKLSETGIFKDMKAIGLEWKSIQDNRVKGIYVYKKDFSAKTPKYKFVEAIQNRFVTHYTDEDVEPETKYSYIFKTYTLNSESPSSQEIIVQTANIINSVSWIYAVQNMPRSAKIIWRPHHNKLVKSYIVERKTLAENKWMKVGTVSGRLSAEYIDSELKDKSIYKYRLRALTYNGVTSNPSKEVRVLTKPIPNPIENIVATNTLAKKIKLSWNPSDRKDFSHYNVYRSEDIDSAYKLVSKSKTTTVVDSIEEDGKYYFYRVSIVDKDGLESISDKKSISGRTLSKPKAPSAVKVLLINNSLKLDWKSSDPRVRNFIVVKKVRISWIKTKSEAFKGVGGRTFVDKLIKPLTEYAYQVYSVDKFGIKSDPSQEVTYKTTKEEGIQAVVETKMPSSLKNEVKQIKETKSVIQAIENFDVSSQ